MAAWFTIDGLNEFKVALQQLPAELKGGATTIVLEAAAHARDEIVAAYPQGPTGNLKKGVRMFVKNIGPFGVSAQVRSTAPHAWLYEHGRCRWGSVTTPPAFVFIPTMERTRRAMYHQLATLMRNAGLTVSEGI